MSIKRMVAASAAALGLFSLGYAAYASPAISVQATNLDRVVSMNTKPLLEVIDYWDAGHRPSYNRRRIARSRGWYRGHSYRRENSGPPYSACYMKCIYSSHPADFCQVAAYHFCY